MLRIPKDDNTYTPGIEASPWLQLHQEMEAAGESLRTKKTLKKVPTSTYSKFYVCHREENISTQPSDVSVLHQLWDLSSQVYIQSISVVYITVSVTGKEHICMQTYFLSKDLTLAI